MSPALKTRQYGPFRGMMNSVDRDLIPLDRISGDSRNAVMDPLTGSVGRRLGNLALNPTTGILESAFGSVARQGFELISASPTDGLPFVAGLFTSEATNEGCIVYKNTNRSSTAWDTLGMDFGAAHYPYDTGNATCEFIMPPLKTRHNPSAAWQRRDYSRCIDAIQRKLIAAGARNVIQMNEELFVPSFSATPFRWRKRFNVNNLTGDEINRIRPWYNPPPAWMPAISNNAGTAGWKNGNWFYYSVVYLMNDGSYTMPVIPREPNGTLANGYGLYKVPADSNYLTWSDIPNGGPDVKATILLRSIQGTATAPPPAGDLRICAVIGPNTTSYIDAQSSDNDLSLVSDPIKVRFDHVAPWRARYAFASNERVWLVNRRPNPCAFFCTFYKANGGGVNNNPDTTGSVTKYSVAVREDQTGVSLKRYFITKTPADAPQPSAGEVAYDLASYSSLQMLLDGLNATVSGGGADAWRAQGVPGADLSANTSNLDTTQLVIPCDTGSNSTLTAHTGKNFNNVQVGMRVYGYADIPAATYVKSVNVGAGTLVLGDGAGASVNATGTHSNVNVYFGWETGDTNPGEFYTFGPGNRATLYWSESYLDGVTDPADKRRVMFTSGEPGWAKNTPLSFFTQNRLVLPDSAGIGMGGAELLNGPILGVVCGSKGIYIIHNPRGGNTGLDSDMNLRPLNAQRGCISPYSIVHGHNWVGYLTADGYVVTDGVTEYVISRDVWNVSTGVGEWAYEIGQCVNGSANDADTCRFFAWVNGGKLYVSYRSAANSDNWPDRMLVYDFSPGMTASGLQEVTLQSGEAYGWSSPLVGYDDATTKVSFWRPGPMFSVRLADGFHKYFLVSVSGLTTEGLVEEFERATCLDDGQQYNPIWYFKTDRFDTLGKKTIHAIRALYVKTTGTAKISASIDNARTSKAQVMALSALSLTTTPQRQRQDIPLSLKAPIDLCELCSEWTDPSSNPQQFRENLVEVDYEELGSYQ